MKRKNKEEKKPKTPKRVLLDQYHVDIWIKPKETMTSEDRRVLKVLLANYFDLLARRIEKELQGKVQVQLTP